MVPEPAGRLPAGAVAVLAVAILGLSSARGPAGAEEPSSFEGRLGAAAVELRESGRGLGRSRPCPPPVPGEADGPRDPACEVDGGIETGCGLFGRACPRTEETLEPAPADGAGARRDPVLRKASCPCLNVGFMALGASGTGGEIDGPGKKGNGRYTVRESACMRLSLHIVTGYVDAMFTFARDEASCRDTLQVNASPGPGQVSYEARRDRGSIQWTENGQRKRENYWNGKAGRRQMTIEMGGGWDHDFIRK
jgi:hypothetical protein